jgi:hypothetical protein
MASQIYFKLKASKEFEALSFTGLSIRLQDLKLAIAEKKFSTEARDFDLIIQDAESSQGLESTFWSTFQAALIKCCSLC